MKRCPRESIKNLATLLIYRVLCRVLGTLLLILPILLGVIHILYFFNILKLLNILEVLSLLRLVVYAIPHGQVLLMPLVLMLLQSCRRFPFLQVFLVLSESLR